MLFIKYISDKYGGSADFAPPVTIPKGASFTDMVALKGKSDIGDKINTQIIQPLIDANERLARSDFPDFNDPNKLGEGQAMVDRLSNLIGIFQKPELDFSQNSAEHDDILGDAYEYLILHADRIKTLLLTISGDQDPNVPASQSREIFYALRRLGKEVEWVRYANGAHRPPNSVAESEDFENRILAWYEKYLKADASKKKTTTP
jgi:hypothetical protein